MGKKILFFDIETSTLDVLHRGYGLKSYVKYFHYKDIVRDWIMLSAAWKWQEDDNVRCVSISSKDPLNDYQVVKTIRDVLDEADIIIGHNIDRFDIRKVNARAIKHGLNPIGKKTTIDTLKISRKVFDMSSNTLGYLAAYLGVGHKESRPDWDAIVAGDADAIAYMRDYNKQDVIVTEGVYNKLRGWHNTHPDLNTIYPVRDVKGERVTCCPSCQSPNIKSAGSDMRRGYKALKAMCADCGRKFVSGREKWS